MSEELVTLDAGEVTIAPASAKQLEEYIDRYQAMAATLDRKMPDQIMTVGGKQFRKKGYWLAIAQGFGLILDLRDEARLTPNENDFGYVVTYRATDPRTGRYCDGDGACYASEKTQARSGIGGTEHNVRAHAHTRATNRAVAKLVGFGEVSADELQDGVEPTTTPQQAEQPSAVKKAAPKQTVAPKKAKLEDHDAAEYLQTVKVSREFGNGGVLWHIFNTQGVKYTFIVNAGNQHQEDTVLTLENACAAGDAVQIVFEEKQMKNGNGTFNVLVSCEVIRQLDEAPATDDIVPF
jgi:hypothetical protein